MFATVSLLLASSVVTPQQPAVQKKLPPVLPQARAAAPASGSVSLPEAVAAESEYNDSRGWFDVLGPGSTTGNLTDDMDVDTYRHDHTSHGILAVDVVAGSPSPLLSSRITLLADDGELIQRKWTSSLPARLATPLPSGTYYIQLGTTSPSGGDYSVTATSTPQTTPTLVPGPATAQTIGSPDGEGFVIVVPSSARTRITGSTSGSIDPVFELRRMNGGYVFYNDDSMASTDPAMEVDLPAGLYYLAVTEWNNATGSITIGISQSTPMSTVSCGGQGTDTLQGEESQNLHRIDLAQPQVVEFIPLPAATNPISDPFVTVLDSDLRTIAFTDDTNSSLFSTLRMPLPAGTYYLSVWQYGNTVANYDYQVNCLAVPAPTPLPTGRSQGTIATSGGFALHSFEVRTGTPMDVRIDPGAFGITDPMLSIVDDAGNSVQFNDDTFSLDSMAGGRLDPGTYWVVVREYLARTGNFDFVVHSHLMYLDAVNNRTPQTVAKAGDLTTLVASPSSIPPTAFLPNLVSGLLLIDLTGSITVGTQLVPPGGKATWPTVPAGLSVFLQGGTLHQFTLPVELTDRLD